MHDPIYLEAVQRFESLLERAKHTSLNEPTAVTLATADADGRPSARMVLLRRFDQRGFIFFTNSQSKKGRELAANPRAALCFYWDELAEQVRVEGVVEKVSDPESNAYWRSRTRESQIGAWASLQSEELDDRATLEARYAEFERQFAGQNVPRPEHWYGYRVAPDCIEFWKSRPARLHERLVYERTDHGWQKKLLYP